MMVKIYINDDTEVFLIQSQDLIPVIVHDGIDAMGNGEYGCVFELFTDGCLNEFISV